MAVVFVVAVAIGRPAGPMAFKAWRSPSTTSSTAAVSPRSLRFSLHFLHFGLSFFFPRCFSFSFLYFHTFLLGRPPPRFFCLFTEFSFSFVASSFVFLPPLPPCGRVPSFTEFLFTEFRFPAPPHPNHRFPLSVPNFTVWQKVLSIYRVYRVSTRFSLFSRFFFFGSLSSSMSWPISRTRHRRSPSAAPKQKKILHGHTDTKKKRLKNSKNTKENPVKNKAKLGTQPNGG